MNPDMEKIIQSELMPGEEILWHGKPCLSKFFVFSDILLFPVGIVFAGIGVGGIIAYNMGFLFLHPIFMIFYIVPGLHQSFGRFILRNRLKRSIIYAITSDRVFVFKLASNGMKKGAAFLKIKDISDESFSHSKSGIGTIVFGQAPYRDRSPYNIAALYSAKVPEYSMSLRSVNYVAQSRILTFFGIEDYEHVFDIYKKAKYSEAAALNAEPQLEITRK